MANRYIYVKSRARWYVVDTADRDARNTFDGTSTRCPIPAASVLAMKAARLARP